MIYLAALLSGMLFAIACYWGTARALDWRHRRKMRASMERMKVVLAEHVAKSQEKDRV